MTWNERDVYLHVCFVAEEAHVCLSMNCDIFFSTLMFASLNAEYLKENK